MNIVLVRSLKKQKAQQDKMAAVQAWQNVTWEDAKPLLMSVGSRHSDSHCLYNGREIKY